MKSLNQIIAELEAFANVHYQIHTFGHGDVWEIAPNSSEIVYPVLWFVPQGATTGLREVTNNFTVLCMDLVRSGEENETEVLSDTLQIILDIVSYYRQQHGEAYIVEFGSNIQPFTERDPDMLSGHSITVSIRQPFNYSECAIPFSAAPTPITPTCSPATIQNAASNPTYQASIASGDNLVLPQVKILDSDGITPILANYIPESDGFVAECSTTCADGTVENSDGTVSVTVGSGDTETFPDTPISANSDLVINQPSGVAIDIPVRYETLGTVNTSIVSGEIVVPDSIPSPPPTWIGGKSISLDGVNDDMQGRLGLPNELETYGFGFVINDPTSANTGIIGMAGFGYLNSSQGTRGAIDIWGRPYDIKFRTSYENVIINRDVTAIIKDTPVFAYFQVSSTGYKSYVNGVQIGATVTRANKYKIRFDEITLGYSRAVGNRRNCRMWTPLVTDGTLDDTEVAALSAAVLGNTTPLISSKILEAWDFGTMPTGVPSTSSATPTAVLGMRNGSPLYCSPTFAAPFGVVEDIT